jgi:hypothetical protein
MMVGHVKASVNKLCSEFQVNLENERLLDPRTGNNFSTYCRLRSGSNCSAVGRKCAASGAYPHPLVRQPNRHGHAAPGWWGRELNAVRTRRHDGCPCTRRSVRDAQPGP